MADPQDDQKPTPEEDQGVPTYGAGNPPPVSPSFPDPNQPEPGLEHPTGHLDSMWGGAAQAVMEAKDFVFGSTPDNQKSETRRAIEEGTERLAQENPVNGLVEGLSQFVTGMVGLRWLQAGAGAGAAVKGAVEVGKAAIVGATAFDPQDERLSNLIESSPGLSNPVTRYLAADPKDSEAEGRFKSALESIGMDLALVGIFAGAMKIAKARKSGDPKAFAAAVDEMEAARAAAREVVEAPPGPVPRDGEVVAQPEMPQGSPQAAVEAVQPSAAPEMPEASPGAPEASAAAPSENFPFRQGLTAEDMEVTIQGEGPRGPAIKLPLVSDQELSDIVKAYRADAEALYIHGGWNAAIWAGHKFGGGNIPWQKLMGPGGSDPSVALDALLQRTAQYLEGPLSEMKGGSILTDEQVQRMVAMRARTWGENPQATLGLLQQAGEAARSMAANMEAAYLLAQRSMQDVQTMSMRINAGLLDEWGGDRAAAHEALSQAYGVAAALFGHAQSMRSAAGRTQRRMRLDFKIGEEAINRARGLDPEQMARIFAETEGDPRRMAKLMNPGIWGRSMDALQYLYVNNLLWGWKTHAVNLATNLYMVGARPMERYIGSFAVGGTAGQRIRAENARQFAYLGSFLGDSWRMGVKSWQMGDSVMAPHLTEQFQSSGNAGKNIARAQYRSMDSLANLAYNAALTGAKGLGAPTRAMGVVDEMVKQTVYRSMVASKAHVQGIEQGLSGQALNDFVYRKVDEAFDIQGRAVNLEALQEARTATFQQDLLPGTLGKSVSNFTANHPTMRFVLPFVRTPTNVLRMGVKMTPGLNMLQREYREMLQGAHGSAAQAQAAGQMAMGGLFLGLASYMAASGLITGGGPSDPTARKNLMATGWRPYAVVTVNEDGSRTYAEYGRVDPVSMPFGIVADIVDVMNATGATEGDEFDKAGAAMKGLLLSMAKQLGNKTYLMSINQAVDAFMQPDQKMEGYLGRLAGNLLPAASGLRMLNPDPNLRDARDFVDQIMNTVPGLSDKLPARYDVFGEPITVHKGLFTTSDTDLAEAEMRRMVEEGRVSGLGPPSSSLDGVDLRDIKLVTGENAYEAYQKWTAQPAGRGMTLKGAITRQIKSAAYQKAADGDTGTRGTKQWMLLGTVSRYRAAARKRVVADPNVRTAILKKPLKAAAAFAQPSQNTPQQQLRNVGEAFGVDLNSLLGGQ